jgi:uncharacterized repeat protein (TIGR01451 family)
MGLLLASAPVQAAESRYAWAKQIGGVGDELGGNIAVDAAGNVYTTGDFTGTVDFDSGPGTFNLTSVGSYDVFVSKLDKDGALVWAKRLGGVTGIASERSIAVDAAGNVYTIGYFTGTVDFDPGPGTQNLTSAGSDTFVSKLNNNGAFVWAKQFGGESRGIAFDAVGNVYISGSFFGAVDFDPGPGTFTLTSLAGNFDVFVSKLTSAGAFVWAKQFGGTGSDNGNSMAVDAAGNVYTTGRFAGTADFDPDAGTQNLNVVGGTFDVFVSKLDSTGAFMWAKQLGGVSDEFGTGIAVDAAGNVYTTGLFQSAVDFDPGPGTFTLTNVGLSDVFVSKLNSAGAFVWAKQLGGTSNDGSNDITVDVAGNVYTTGSFSGTADFDPGAGTQNLTSVGSFDGFVSKLDSTGAFVWAKQLGGTDNDGGASIAVDATGNVYTIGWFAGTADFDPGPGTQNLTSAGFQDIFVSKLGPPQVRLVTTNQPVRSAGTTITITFSVENQGPDSADGTQINIPLPSNVSGFSWNCSATGGAICPSATVNGALNQTIATMPLGGKLTYIATGTIITPYEEVASDGSFSSPDLTFTGAVTFRVGEYIMVFPIIVVP